MRLQKSPEQGFFEIFTSCVTDNLFVVTHKFLLPRLACFYCYKNMAVAVKAAEKSKAVCFFLAL